MQPICLITGASSGLGKALAIYYAELGWQVLAIARNQQRLDELHQLHSNIVPCAAEVTDVAAVSALFQRIHQTCSHIDVAILNAGTCEYVDFNNWSAGLFQRTFALNFHAVVDMVPQLLPLLQQSPKPTLAIVSSLAHYFPFTRSEAYGASKAALTYFTDSLRVDLADTAIQVSLIEPGFVDTPLTAANDFKMPFLLSAEEAAARIGKSIAAGELRCRFPKRLVSSLLLLNCLPYTWRQRVAARMRNQ